MSSPPPIPKIPLQSLTDRSRTKSNLKGSRSKSITREIVIHTEEPDIPQITIYKVENTEHKDRSEAVLIFQKVMERVLYRLMLQGLSKMNRNLQLSKIRLTHTNALANILRARQRKLVQCSWLRLAKIISAHKGKLNSSRLISKLAELLLNKAKIFAFNRLRNVQIAKDPSQIEKNYTQLKNKNQLIAQQNEKLKSLEFSQKFIAVCKKYLRVPNMKQFLSNIDTELGPNVSKELERYAQLRGGKISELSNQTVLNVLSNHINTLKQLGKEQEKTAADLRDSRKSEGSSRAVHYEKVEQQFEKADKEIKDTFKGQKIDENELAKVIENQIKVWNKNKDLPLYNSRAFVSTIITKLLKNGPQLLNQYLDTLQDLLDISSDQKKVEQFKSGLKKGQRGSAVLLKISNKIIELGVLGMQPILERSFSENEEIFMTEIKYIREEIADFINKYNTTTLDKTKLKKTFSSKRQKAPEELRDLYLVLNQLIGLIQMQQNPKETQKNQAQSDKNTIRVLETFMVCLKQGNYQKWQNFIALQSKKGDNKDLLKVLQSLNDMVNEKITAETSNSDKQLQKLRANDSKLKEQVNNLRAKNIELDKKIKVLEASRIKQGQSLKHIQTIKEKQKIVRQWETKYKDLQQKFERLQKNKQRQTSTSRSKDSEERKKYLAELERQTLLLQKRNNEFEKINKEFDIVNRQNLQNQSKIKKYQRQITKLQTQLSPKKHSKIQSQLNEARQTNQTLNIKINQMRQKVEELANKLESAQAEVQMIRKNNLKQQLSEIQIEKLKNEKQSIFRKTKILENTIENLRQELAIKTNQFEESEKKRLDEMKPRRNTHGRSVSTVEKNAQHSIQLIKELNTQLESLKRSEMTLQQINRQLEHVRNNDQDISIYLNKVQGQNSELRKQLSEKQTLIFNLQSSLRVSNDQINSMRLEYENLLGDLSSRDTAIEKIENLLKEREILVQKQIKIKDEEFNKLKNTLREREDTIKRMESELLSLTKKYQQFRAPQVSSEEYTRIKAQLEHAQNTNRKLQLSIASNSQLYNSQIFSLQAQIKELTAKISEKDQQIRARNAERQKWQQQLRTLNLKHNHVLGQNTRLMSEITELHASIERLRLEISSVSSSAINSENIIWLVTNIIASLVRIHPKPESQLSLNSPQTIFNDLNSIRLKFQDAQADMFKHIEQYAVMFIQSDIGKLRYELAVRVDQLTALRDRLLHFIEGQLQSSSASLDVRYQFDAREKHQEHRYQTPLKGQVNIVEELTEIKRQTMQASHLFATQKK